MHNAQANIGHNMPPTEMEMLNDRLAIQDKDIRSKLAMSLQYKIPEIIPDDGEAGLVTDHIKTLGQIEKAVAKAHESEKAPFWECCKSADGWKNGLLIEIAALKKKASSPLDAFLAKKAEAERQRQMEYARKQQQEAEILAEQAALHSDAGIHDTAQDLLHAAVEAEDTANRVYHNSITAKPSNLAKTRGFGGSVASQKLTWVGEVENLAAINLEILRPYLNEEALQKAINAYVRNGGRDCSGVRIYQKSSLTVR